MQNVSRGTDPAIRPLLFRKEMRTATVAGEKTETRRIISADNSKVHPGTFERVDFETGRARRLSTPEVRARCSFDSGRVRVVTVSPIVRGGDLFWVKAGRFASRAKSETTLQVLTVDVARVQDMTDEDALREGVAFLPYARGLPEKDGTKTVLAPRLLFAKLWDDINGKGAWVRNDWVWVYRYHMYPENIDAMLARWEARS